MMTTISLELKDLSAVEIITRHIMHDTQCEMSVVVKNMTMIIKVGDYQRMMWILSEIGAWSLVLWANMCHEERK